MFYRQLAAVVFKEVHNSDAAQRKKKKLLTF